jgi:hypothetical protein
MPPPVPPLPVPPSLGLVVIERLIKQQARFDDVDERGVVMARDEAERNERFVTRPSNERIICLKVE